MQYPPMWTTAASHLAAVLPLSLCWRLAHRTLALRTGEVFAGSCVSFLHSVLVVCLILATDGADSTIMLWAAGSQNSPSQELVLTTSLSYFLHDTLKSGWSGWRVAMLLHHIGGLVFLALPLVLGHHGACTIQALLALEASNPCYHARRMLLHRNGFLYLLLDLLYFATFSYLRLICSLVLTIDVLVNRERMSLFYIWGSLFFQFVSFVFMVLIIQYMIVKYFYPFVRRVSNAIAEKFFEDDQYKLK